MKNKGLILGIDVGSISASAALINEDKKIISTAYSFHKGDPEGTLKNLLRTFDLGSISGIAVTSSTPDIIKIAEKFDTQICYIAAAKLIHKKPGAILIVGGEKFGLIQFDEKGEYQNYKSNTSCAAGTGSFLDQQAERLNVGGIASFSDIAYRNKGHIPKIASRCSVFAKTDIIHAQQEGYSLEEICDGLCHGLAKNVADTVLNNQHIHEPLIFAGGVSKNSAVVKHMSDLAGMKITPDEHSGVYGAIGSAVCLIDSKELKEPVSINNPDEIIHKEFKEKSYHYSELELKYSSYPDFTSLEKYEFQSAVNPSSVPVEVDIYEKLNDINRVFIGIDIGSTSTKAILTDINKNILAGFYTRTSGQPIEAVQSIFETIEDIELKKNIKFEYLGAGTTGSGRKFIGSIIGADLALDEITAHARAAFELDPEVDTIIEIGGQDSKFTTLKNGMVTFSIMNNVCAAGTGSFIEEQAKKLGCPLSEFSDRTDNSQAPMSSDRCTVFMERDLNYYLSEGYRVSEILASVLHSIRENYLTKVAIEKNIGSKIFFQGATARNRALVAAFEQKLKKPIMVSKFCHLTGAIGSALTLLDEYVREGNLSKLPETKFKGTWLYKSKIPITGEICELCANSCKIKLADINGEKTAYGFLCGRDYETKKFVNMNSSGFDMLKEWKKNSHFKETKSLRDDLTIGIPAGLHIFEELPLWRKFFDLLSIKTVTSEDYKTAVKDGKKLTGAEFCAPITALHGHTQYIADKCDYIFLPVFLETEEKSENLGQYCYYTQYSASLIKSIPQLTEKIISPLLHFGTKTFFSKFELYKNLKSISDKKIGFMDISNAYDKATEFYAESRKHLSAVYEKNKPENGDIGVLLIGRPYTLLSKNMNNGIPDIFARLGIKAFSMDMINIDERSIEDLNPILKAINWKYSSEILKAAKTAAITDGLYPVFVTSFKCTPDAFTVEYFKDIMDRHKKPYLILQLDEHDSSVGYETRIEAGIRAFRNHLSRKSGIKQENFRSQFPEIITKEHGLKGKTLLFPSWDPQVCGLLTAVLRHEGIDARLLEESHESIRRSLNHNTGQCIPLNAIMQNSIDYIKKYRLDPKKTAIWNMDARISCNLRMIPYYMKRLLSSYGEGMEDVSCYLGEITFIDISLNTAINSYYAYMFGGMLTKCGCRIRPYEVHKGETDAALDKAFNILENIFEFGGDRDAALEKIITMLEAIETVKTDRPKAAVFGDLYSRDNHIMNHNLIKTIEDNGGEAVTTPYSDYMKLIADPYTRKWMREGYYSDAITVQALYRAIKVLEKKYYKYFDRILNEPISDDFESASVALGKLNVKIQHTGESMDNILKIFYLINKYPDIALFVQANPAFCCPSLVTEGMSEQIESLTGVPVITITYDGTGGDKNDIVIPYLKYPRKKKEEEKEKTACLK